MGIKYWPPRKAILLLYKGLRYYYQRFNGPRRLHLNYRNFLPFKLSRGSIEIFLISYQLNRQENHNTHRLKYSSGAKTRLWVAVSGINEGTRYIMHYMNKILGHNHDIILGNVLGPFWEYPVHHLRSTSFVVFVKFLTRWHSIQYFLKYFNDAVVTNKIKIKWVSAGNEEEP